MVAKDVVILEADRLYGKAQISVEACRQMVEEFVKGGSKPVPLTFFATKMELGLVTEMVYDEYSKQIRATVELKLEVYAGIEPRQKIDLPMGDIKVIDGVLKGGIIVPKIEEVK